MKIKITKAQDDIVAVSRGIKVGDELKVRSSGISLFPKGGAYPKVYLVDGKRKNSRPIVIYEDECVIVTK